MADLLTIGELSARSGVASSALRFYEERGLISSERASSGHRRFARPVIRRVAFIVFAQRVGLSLDEIRDELVKLPADRAPNRGDWAKLSSSWSGRIDARIAELERLKEGLTDCIGCGCLSLGRCQLANPGDRAAAARPRPALLDRRPPGLTPPPGGDAATLVYWLPIPPRAGLLSSCDGPSEVRARPRNAGCAARVTRR